MTNKLLRSVRLVVSEAQFRTADIVANEIKNEGKDTSHIKF